MERKTYKIPTREHPGWVNWVKGFAVFLAIMIVILWITQPTSAFFYYVLRGITSFLGFIFWLTKTFWMFILGFIIAIITGPYLNMVDLHRVNTEKREKMFWRPSTYEVFDDLATFKLWDGRRIWVNVGLIDKNVWRIHIRGRVIVQSESSELIVSGAEGMEVIKSKHDKEYIQYLQARLTQLMEEKGKTVPSWEEIREEIEKSKKS